MTFRTNRYATFMLICLHICNFCTLHPMKNQKKKEKRDVTQMRFEIIKLLNNCKIVSPT